MNKTIRLTTAQALLRFLDNQYVNVDGVENKFVHGVFGIFGHGCVVGLGEALASEENDLPFYQAKNEQGAVHAAIGFAKERNRHGMMAVTSSIGPGATTLTVMPLAANSRAPDLASPKRPALEAL